MFSVCIDSLGYYVLLKFIFNSSILVSFYSTLFGTYDIYWLCIILMGIVAPGKFLVCLYCTSTSSRSVSVTMRPGLTSFQLLGFCYFDLLLYSDFFRLDFILFNYLSIFGIYFNGTLSFFSGFTCALFLTDCMFFIKKFFDWLSGRATSDLVRSLIDSLVVYLLRSMEFSLEIYILIFYALLCEFSLD